MGKKLPRNQSQPPRILQDSVLAECVRRFPEVASLGPVASSVLDCWPRMRVSWLACGRFDDRIRRGLFYEPASASYDEPEKPPRTRLGSGQLGMTRSRYIVGIDLGTTNCAVAYVDTQGRERPAADIRNFEVPQLVAPGETAPRPMLPRSSTCRAAHELPPGAARLPWSEEADRIVGEFAQDSRGEGARPPGLERQELALPSRRRSRGRHPALGQPAGGQARSRRSRPRRPTCGTSATPGTTRLRRRRRRTRLEQQEVVLTVPASFDEAARELTLEAAKRAELGLGHAARGAAGGVLLLDRLAPGPLAARGPGRGADPGLRHRRRHDRLQPDHRRRDADRARASAAWPSAIT